MAVSLHLCVALVYPKYRHAAQFPNNFLSQKNEAQWATESLPSPVLDQQSGFWNAYLKCNVWRKMPLSRGGKTLETRTGWTAKLNKASGFGDCKSSACCKNSPQVSNFVLVCILFATCCFKAFSKVFTNYVILLIFFFLIPKLYFVLSSLYFRHMHWWWDLSHSS